MAVVYLSHPEVRIDPAVPVPDWGLSDVGVARAEALARTTWARGLGRVATSRERKARETADILARAAGVVSEVCEGLHENDRSATGFLPPDEFEAVADRFFARPEESVRGWETAVAAQARVVRAVEEVLRGHPDHVPLAIVGHGAVGTLLWLRLTGRAIDRSADQDGPGNLYAFGLEDRRPRSGWVRWETWPGLAERNVND